MLFAFDGIHVKSPSGPPSIHHTLFRPMFVLNNANTNNKYNKYNKYSKYKSPSGPPSIHHTLLRLTYDVCFEQRKYKQQEKTNNELSEIWI